MRLWRSHPILFITLIGAVIGVGNALVLEIPAILGKPSRGALSLLQPRFNPTPSAGVLQVAVILLIEVAANVLIYALIFFLLGCLIAGVRRFLRRGDAASR